MLDLRPRHRSSCCIGPQTLGDKGTHPESHQPDPDAVRTPRREWDVNGKRTTRRQQAELLDDVRSASGCVVGNSGFHRRLRGVGCFMRNVLRGEDFEDHPRLAYRFTSGCGSQGQSSSRPSRPPPRPGPLADRRHICRLTTSYSIVDLLAHRRFARATRGDAPAWPRCVRGRCGFELLCQRERHRVGGHVI